MFSVVRAAGRHQTAVWMVAGLLLAGAGWLATPRPVPLYDGIGLPDEPYRYVAPPPHTPRTKPPVAARGVLSASRGMSAVGQVTSDEYGPQVALYLADGAISAPAAATRITATAVPRAPGTAAGDSAILGNVYEVSAVSDAGPVHFTGNAESGITLRAPSIAGGLPVVCYRAGVGAAWRDLPTQRVGQDTFLAPVPGAGGYALAPPHAGPSAGAVRGAQGGRGAGASRASGAGAAVAMWLAGTVAVMALIVLGVRLLAIRRRALSARISGGTPRMTRRGHPPRRPPGR